MDFQTWRKGTGNGVEMVVLHRNDVGDETRRHLRCASACRKTEVGG